MTCKVSVIIPCYNQGCFVQEAVDSVLASTLDDFEIIIVNDGSTDGVTNALLADYHQPKTRVITTTNQGLAMARNNGIKAAQGKYILPLDADDKIAPTYLEKATAILDENEKIGIVYCRADFFGTKQGLWELPAYKFPDILNGNCIFCTALFRKADWEKVDGYKREMIYGWEDWEFWLSLIELYGCEKCVIHCIHQPLFYYRQHKVSMVTQIRENEEKQNFLWTKMFNFHKRLYLKYFKSLLPEVKVLFYKLGLKRPPFFWKEKTKTHKIYHLGPFTVTQRRKRK